MKVRLVGLVSLLLIGCSTPIGISSELPVCGPSIVPGVAGICAEPIIDGAPPTPEPTPTPQIIYVVQTPVPTEITSAKPTLAPTPTPPLGPSDSELLAIAKSINDGCAALHEQEESKTLRLYEGLRQQLQDRLAQQGLLGSGAGLSMISSLESQQATAMYNAGVRADLNCENLKQAAYLDLYYRYPNYRPTPTPQTAATADADPGAPH